MIARNQIRKQLTRMYLAILGLVIVFALSFLLCALTGSTLILISGIAIFGIGFYVSLNFAGPKCPFCDSSITTRGDKIGNYCNDCGKSFDKKIPSQKIDSNNNPQSVG